MSTLRAPTNVAAHVVSMGTATCDISVTWAIEEQLHPGPYTVTLEYRTDGGSWGLLDEWTTYDAPTTAYLHDDVAVNHLYGYRAYWHCSDCGLTSPVSVEGNVGAYLITPSETITLTDTCAVTHDATSTETFCYDTITLTATLTAVPAYNVTLTDTITLTDYCIAGATLKTNYAFYLGTVDGDINLFSASYKGDGTTPIVTRWRSKETDFSDQYPQYLDDRKWIDRVRLVYVDKDASTPVTIKVSTDGGVNWTTSSATVGTGSGAVKDCSFWFNVSGRYFQFEVESASASELFKWISLEPQFHAAGEYWEVS